MAGLGGVFALLGLGILCLWTLASSGLTSATVMSALSDSYMQHTVFITVKQALLSVFFSTLIGVCGALSFHRRAQFRGRNLILLGCFCAMIMPSTVAALSLLKLWGQSGAIAQTPLSFLLPEKLGLWSVVLAHVFFNAPLILRVCLSALEAVSVQQRQNAALLNLSPWSYFIILDWPAIRASLPSVMGLVFLLCATSFSLVLMLGGGPFVTTLEVSIYTSLRFDFNLPKAAFLSLVQLILCLVLLRLFGRNRNHITRLTQDVTYSCPRPDSTRFFMKMIDGFVICGVVFLNIIPLLLLISQSDLTAGLALLETRRFWDALYHSLTLAMGASFIGIIFAFLIGFLSHEAQLRRQSTLPYLIEASHSLFLVIPALVLGTALFILMRSFVDVSAYAFWILMLGNGLLALPFCHRIIAPALLRHLTETDRLTALLHIGQLKRLVMIIIPSLRSEIGFALGLSAALSFGDLGIITLFGSQNFETLPYMLYSFMSRYGADEADLLALILLGLSLILYASFVGLIGLWGRHFLRS